MGRGNFDPLKPNAAENSGNCLVFKFLSPMQGKRLENACLSSTSHNFIETGGKQVTNAVKRVEKMDAFFNHLTNLWKKVRKKVLFFKSISPVH